MHTHTLAELSGLLADKKASSVEITQAFLKRAQHHHDLNCFITLNEEAALAQAQQADALRKKQKLDAHPLLGIPLAQKDIFCTQGLRTTAGSKMLEDFVPPYNATVIERFNQAGAVLLGKTNMDEFAMGSSNEHSHFGAVANPWAKDCVPGGSSGGSAAAVAARLAPGATGTDTGGSIRQPAAFCGLTGLKPTYGLVSRFGMIAFASSLDQAGPMTLTAEDAALMLNTMAGFDPKDATSIERPPVSYTADLNNDLAGLTLGLPEECFNSDLNPRMAEKIEAVVEELKKLGVRFRSVSLSHLHLAAPTYYVLAPAECSSNLSRYDGVRYGYRCKDPVDLNDLYTRTRSEGFGAEVKRRILMGTYVLSSGYYDAYYRKAQQVRQLMAQDFKNVFESVDLLLMPTTPSPAFRAGEKTDDPLSMYLSDIYTIAVNLAGLPALSMPMGFLDKKPVGVQLIGPHFQEARLLNVAHRYQQETAWHQQMPALDEGSA